MTRPPLALVLASFQNYKGAQPNLRDAKKLCINSSLALVGGGFQGFFADHASLQGLGEDDGVDEDAWMRIRMRMIMLRNG